MLRETLPGLPEDMFGTYILKPAFEATFPAGDTLLAEFEAELDAAEPGGFDPIGGLKLFSLGACYAADAIKAMNIKKPQLAWTMICDAHYYRGLIMEQLCNVLAADKTAESSADTLSKILEGAALGGKMSAKARQANRKVPAPEVLRAERDSLIAKGVPARGVAGLLAMRYSCTSTHIRNELNRN